MKEKTFSIPKNMPKEEAKLKPAKREFFRILFLSGKQKIKERFNPSKARNVQKMHLCFFCLSFFYWVLVITRTRDSYLYNVRFTEAFYKILQSMYVNNN